MSGISLGNVFFYAKKLRSNCVNKKKSFLSNFFSKKLVGADNVRKKMAYNQFDKSQKFLGELFLLMKSSPAFQMLPLKNTLESIKTLRALLSNSRQLLKKLDKTFKGKLRFPVFVLLMIQWERGQVFLFYNKVYCINKGRKTQKHYKNYSKFTVMLQDEQNYCIEKRYRL